METYTHAIHTNTEFEGTAKSVNKDQIGKLKLIAMTQNYFNDIWCGFK